MGDLYRVITLRQTIFLDQLFRPDCNSEWKLRWEVTDETTGRLGTDPWRFTVYVPLAGDVLAAELDDNLDVVETREEAGQR